MEHNGYVYCEMQQLMCGIPQADNIANNLLTQHIEPYSYYHIWHTPGFYNHKWRPTMFSLVVDVFGVQYVGEKHAIHLCNTIKRYYEPA